MRGRERDRGRTGALRPGTLRPTSGGGRGHARVGRTTKPSEERTSGPLYSWGTFRNKLPKLVRTHILRKPLGTIVKSVTPSLPRSQEGPWDT